MALPQQKVTNQSRIVVIGAGAVGATSAYTLFLRQRAAEIVLIDTRKDKAHGDALDMNHGMPFVGSTKVWAGDYSDCEGAGVVVITAGTAQAPGETRLDLLKRNASIVRNIVRDVVKYNSDGVLLVATNPVDILSYLAWKESGWPNHRVLGTGTLLDTARFRYLISQVANVDPRSIHAHIIGEHGDSEVPVWSRANIAGVPVELDDARKDDVFRQTRDAAYEIIQAKGATYYAIALAVDRICTAILRNESSVLNVSALLTDYCGISDVYLGVPAVVGASGVSRLIPLDPLPNELELLQKSAETLKENLRAILCGE